ncbi:carboxypeptidase regulatory-like domain-containing protein, partial [bacterium]|nr:carboxypeptidase regulatory-like domain-containing protein [bacterium]
TGYPVAGATVLVQTENINISATTGDDGGFLFSNQDYKRQFKMSIGAAGFLSQSYYQISADTSFACILEPLNSTITGRVIDHGSSVADVCLSLIRQPENCFYDSVRTDADGQFMFSRVMAGSYHFQITDSRYLSATPEINFELALEDRVWVDVPVKKAIVASIEMAGAENILSGTRTRYRLTAFSAEGEKLPLPTDILWHSNPAAAGEVQNGIFYPTSGFFSTISLSARSDSLHLADSVTVIIAAPLTPETDSQFNDGNGFRVQISPGSVGEEIALGVVAQTPFSGGNNANGWRPAGKMYKLTPMNYSFFMPLEITVPAPAGTSVEQFIVGKWQSEAREWVPIGGIPAGQSVTGEIHSTGSYVLISSPLLLGLSSLELCPNPFSPMIDTDGDGEAGLAIRFIATSATSMTPKVTVKIYNLTGQLIRTLWDERVVEKAVPLVVRWDGLTQHQRMARNGRYLLNMVVSDDSDTKEYWHSIVLLK